MRCRGWSLRRWTCSPQAPSRRVVGHHERHVADLGGSALVDALHLVAPLTRHLDEQRRHHRAVVHVHARRRHADRVHARHLGGGGLERRHDLVEVVRGILGDLGVPHHFFGVHRLAVDHGRHLAVASTRVEADAAAVLVAADGLGGLVGGGEVSLGADDDLKGLLVHVIDEPEVEGALSGGAVRLGQLRGDVVAAAQVDAESRPCSTA